MMGKFAIRKDNRTRLYAGRHMGEMALAVFARGPGYAVTIVTDLQECLAVDFASAGFAIDVDHRRAFVFDDTVAWTGSAPLASRVAAVNSLDLYDHEACVADPFVTSDTPEQWLQAVAALPLQDSWKGWEMRWTNAKDFPKLVGEVYAAQS